MDELSALDLIGETLSEAGDDAAVVDELVITIDMLHEATDFPAGTTRYTAGWRSVGASLSDIAAMGASPVATVAAYGSPAFEQEELVAFIEGAQAVSQSVGTEYVGGDLDSHQEFTVATAAIGRTTTPVYRSGASPGESVYVTGTLGRSAAALRAMAAGHLEDGNRLLQFSPRIDSGVAVAGTATAMMDSSDGLARSLHQLAEASDCGFSIESDRLPIDESVYQATDSDAESRQLALHFGEDFELVLTGQPAEIDAIRATCETPITHIGTVTDSGVRIDNNPLPNAGYEHTGRPR